MRRQKTRVNLGEEIEGGECLVKRDRERTGLGRAGQGLKRRAEAERERKRYPLV